MTDDVPSSIDLRNALVARTWTYESDWLRPYRPEVRACIAEQIAGATRVLELGAGPGLLAEEILARSPLTDYTLLDFSPAMLRLARRRVGAYPYATFILADFLDPGWTDELGTFDVIVTMQAVHELRHKRRAASLYEQSRRVLRVGGQIVVCDHMPPDDRPLHATSGEQHAALASAGFVDITTIKTSGTLYVIAARHR